MLNSTKRLKSIVNLIFYDLNHFHVITNNKTDRKFMTIYILNSLQLNQSSRD